MIADSDTSLYLDEYPLHQYVTCSDAYIAADRLHPTEVENQSKLINERIKEEYKEFEEKKQKRDQDWQTLIYLISFWHLSPGVLGFWGQSIFSVLGCIAAGFFVQQAP